MRTPTKWDAAILSAIRTWRARESYDPAAFEIAAEIGAPQSTVYRHLARMVREGTLIRTAWTRGWEIPGEDHP